MRDDISLSSVVVVAEDQLSTDLDGEAVTLALKSGRYYSLNDTGTRIWNLVQEPRTVNEIRDVILAEYEVDPELGQNDLLAILKDLATKGLIEVRDGSDG